VTGADRPVRVLHVVKGLGPGGAERLIVSLAEATDPDAARFAVAYVLPWKQQLVDELEALGVGTHLLAGRAGMWDPRWPARLRRLAAQHDVVHLHSPAVAAVARPLLRSMPAARRPIVVSTEHNTWSSHGALTRLANAATQPLDEVTWAVSDDVVASAWRRRRGRMEVLHHGIPVDRFDARRAERAAARAAHGWGDDDVVVAIVANLRANKDYPTLFRAAELAVAEDHRLRFVSIGQGVLEADLRAALASTELGPRFTMLGYHADPPAVLAGADVFTLSSVHEGLPISLLEAMALGLPPVVTDVGANGVVVTDGIDGVVVPARAPERLAAAYVALAADPGRRAALGAAARRRAADFDIVTATRVLEARYVELAAGVGAS
jgi:glycosyltransferase involved in cell wall biosynthesis